MPANVRVYLDITIGTKSGGRVVFELFNDANPLAVENFRGLCTGEYGIAKNSRLPLCYRGCQFFKCIPGFIIQSGDFECNNGNGGESIYGGTFKDESFVRRHAQAGVLSMANKGRHTNASQFFVTLKKAIQLDGKHVAIGQVVQGMEVIRAIEKVPVDSHDAPRVPIVIVDCGEVERQSGLRKSHPMYQLKADYEALMSTVQTSDDPVLSKLGIPTAEGATDERKKKALPSSEIAKQQFRKVMQESRIAREAQSEVADDTVEDNDDDDTLNDEELDIDISGGPAVDQLELEGEEKGEIEKERPDDKDDDDDSDSAEDGEDGDSMFDRLERVEARADSKEGQREASEKSVAEIAREKRLYELRLRMNQGRRLNAKETALEAKRQKDPKFEKFEYQRGLREVAKSIRGPGESLEDLIDDEDENGRSKKERKKKEEEWNADPEIEILRGKRHQNETAEAVQGRDNARLKRRANAEKSFGLNALNQEAIYRAHEKRSAGLTLQAHAYQEQKDRLGNIFYDPTAALVSADFTPTEDAKERVAAAVEKQKAKRRNFRRRRMHVEEENVAYINEGNREYNKKLERAFGAHALELRQNLERGTAL